MPSRSTYRAPRLHCCLAIGVSAGVLSGCGAGGQAPVPGPEVDGRQVAGTLQRQTRLLHPTRVVFDWKINESGARFEGRGVARMEPDYKARLDLFLENGELVVSAALVDDDLRLPGAAPPGLIPPPPLLWASLGVFRPGADAELLGGADLGDGRLQIRYGLSDGQQLRYEVVEGRIVQVELLDAEEVSESMGLERGTTHTSLPERALYRNVAAFRELDVRATESGRVEAFPPEIWSFER